MLLALAQLGLAAVLLVLSLLTAYLLLLTAAAVVVQRSQRPKNVASHVRNFAILVPAHNEEALLGRLLASLSQLEYPADHFDVCVVADNCVDATAEIGRTMGAHVYERTDPTQKAKGFALRWLLQTLRDAGRSYDAYVVFDADSVAAPNFLQAMNIRLERGNQVIQAYYSVQNAGQSAVAGLRYAALAAIHYVRPLGRSRFGLSCGLKGNGMCFAAPIIERFGWNWFTLAEDVEFHLALIRAGIRVDFAPETTVHADMPLTLAQAASQNARWEQGRLQLVRRFVPGLLVGAVRQRSVVQLDAAAEQLIPPLSVPFALSAVCVGLGIGLGSVDATLVAGFNLVGQIVYLLCGLALVRAPRGMYVALLAAPVYIAWKLWLYARSLAGGSGGGWVRTARTSDSPL